MEDEQKPRKIIVTARPRLQKGRKYPLRELLRRVDLMVEFVCRYPIPDRRKNLEQLDEETPEQSLTRALTILCDDLVYAKTFERIFALCQDSKTSTIALPVLMNDLGIEPLYLIGLETGDLIEMDKKSEVSITPFGELVAKELKGVQKTED